MPGKWGHVEWEFCTSRKSNSRGTRSDKILIYYKFEGFPCASARETMALVVARHKEGAKDAKDYESFQGNRLMRVIS